MDARLISQGAETTAIGSEALVSVAEGAGQPQKNIQLGNFADSMAKAVPQKTKDQVSITGLYAKTTDGKMVELTSESVASVVAGLYNYGIGNDVNSLTNTGTWVLGQNTANAPSSDYATITVVNIQGYIHQTFHSLNVRETYIRSYNKNSWSAWQRIDNFGYNSLADLSAGVAGLMIENNLYPYMYRGIVGQTSSVDFNTLKGNGSYLFINADSGNKNFPTGANGGVLTVDGSNPYILQYFKQYDGAVWTRMLWGDYWYKWERLDNFGYNTLDDLAVALKPKLGL